MRRRKFFALALLAPLSFLLFRQSNRVGKYVEIDGWILRSDDI